MNDAVTLIQLITIVPASLLARYGRHNMERIAIFATVMMAATLMAVIISSLRGR